MPRNNSNCLANTLDKRLEQFKQMSKKNIHIRTIGGVLAGIIASTIHFHPPNYAALAALDASGTFQPLADAARRCRIFFLCTVRVFCEQVLKSGVCRGCTSWNKKYRLVIGRKN